MSLPTNKMMSTWVCDIVRERTMLCKKRHANERVLSMVEGGGLDEFGSMHIGQRLRRN